MSETRECPLCGESMRLHVRERVEPIPGTGQATRRQVREWVCPQCDYFEELEDEGER
jgi:YgiT-type zinc finger domain-containing protein